MFILAIIYLWGFKEKKAILVKHLVEKNNYIPRDFYLIPNVNFIHNFYKNGKALFL